MKKVLIISPYFPPANAADMQRVRMAVSYLPDYGWNPAVMSVDETSIEMPSEPLLMQSLPENLDLIKIPALPVKWTRKVGLGALALRSLFYYWKTGSAWIKSNRPDLVFFSTTQYPVLILGRYWKWRFGCYVVYDIQDPWYHPSLPPDQRPAKFWFSNMINGLSEPFAMKAADGVLAVSQGYLDVLQARYKNLSAKNCLVLPFGGFEKDFEIAATLPEKETKTKFKTIRYVGRGGQDMSFSIHLIFEAFRKGLRQNPELFKQVRFQFRGTSYAPKGQGKKSIFPVAEQLGLSEFVSEETDRMPYFESLQFLLQADLLFIPGSVDPNYTASKLVPYILCKKPVFSIFNENSSVVRILAELNAGVAITFNSDQTENPEILTEKTFSELEKMLLKLPFTPETNWKAFEPYSAGMMTKTMADFFEKVTVSDE